MRSKIHPTYLVLLEGEDEERASFGYWLASDDDVEPVGRSAESYIDVSWPASVTQAGDGDGERG